MRLLVANRAEIAVRIMSTAAVAGIETVAVYPDDDAACAHVGRADVAVRLPGAGPAAYLDVDAVVDAAVAAGCDTLHPGYGFLAESGALARRCAAAGVRFAGPPPEVLDLFGDKTAARARAASLGVPLARASDGPVGPSEAHAFLASLGPGAAVMVKAVAGGGGRGTRPVTDPAGLDDALRRSAAEAAVSFGNPAVYVEELLTSARHIEVQVIGDGSGVAVLGDRDCSLQRRRQKLMEIAPAALGDSLRAELHEAARLIIGSTPYAGLATVEFLITGSRFVFLEVNPRIQVEHTVTEEVTGLDLVELMLRITAGATLADLGLSGNGPPAARGCAIQARVNAETPQPDGTVLPASGTLTLFQPPAGRGVRVDTYGYPGYTVSPRYDSLLAKVITTGHDRGAAASRLRGALAVMSYDYTVLAGTQGLQNHRKSDRLFELARRERLPVVIFAEGGGGRPGDTDTAAVAQLDVPTFRMLAGLNGRVPLVAVVSGYCFAGNAALAAACDVIIATEGSSLGMGGPAMIEGGGLGVVAPGDVGPMAVQVRNGVVDVLVPDDAAAVAAARQYLGYFGGPAGKPADHRDQRMLRHLVPENRVRAYDIRPVIEILSDPGSVLELRPEFGVGIITALARLDGRPVGILANNPRHLGGAIDGDAADKATRFLEVCQAHRIAVISLCDTPGFMVGPEAEKTATVRRFGAMFVAGARLTVPLCMVVLRKGYGLGAMAMAGGDLKAPLLCVAWPTGEFGGMGLEGAVRLGFRKELDAIADPARREQRYEQLVAEYYEKGKALSAAAAFEVDDVIDPAQTRQVLIATLARTQACS